jgi:hypothetical protein
MVSGDAGLRRETDTKRFLSTEGVKHDTNAVSTAWIAKPEQ